MLLRPRDRRPFPRLPPSAALSALRSAAAGLALEELEEEPWPFVELVEGVFLPEPSPVLLELLPPAEGIGSGMGSETDTPEFDGLDVGGETQPAAKNTIPVVTSHFFRPLFKTIK